MKKIIKHLLYQKGYRIQHQKVISNLEKLENAGYIPSGLGDCAWLLYGLVRALKPEVCVEIGSALGRSACFIGMALQANQKGLLYAIDPHASTSWNDQNAIESLPQMKKNITSLQIEDRVEIIQKTSLEVAKGWNKKIDLLFIDGDHSYEGVKADWNIYSPYVCKTGFILFHDTLRDQEWEQHMRYDMGVPEFVEGLREKGYPVVTLCKDHGLSLLQPSIKGYSLKA